MGIWTFTSARAIPTYGSLLPNVLLRNKEGKFFADVTASSGTGELHKGHELLSPTSDNDGDEDLLTELAARFPETGMPSGCLKNPGNGNDWINLHLVGVKTNRSAIGARIN